MKKKITIKESQLKSAIRDVVRKINGSQNEPKYFPYAGEGHKQEIDNSLSNAYSELYHVFMTYPNLFEDDDVFTIMNTLRKLMNELKEMEG